MDLCKGLMVFFNILFMLSGLGFIGVGIWLVVTRNDNPVGDLLGSAAQSFAYLGYSFIGIGAIIAFVAILGCLGALVENKCLLNTFIFFLSFFLVITVIMAVAAFVLAVYMKQLTESVSKTIITAYEGDTVVGGIEPTDSLIDDLQTDNKCCGYDNGDDYVNSAYDTENSDVAPWPASCCVPTAITACRSVATAAAADLVNSYANQGCFDKLEPTLRKYLYIIGGVSIGVTVLEILAIIFGCCVSSNIGSGKKAVKPWN